MRPISAFRIPFLASGGATAALLVMVTGAPDPNAIDRVRVEPSGPAAGRVDGTPAAAVLPPLTAAGPQTPSARPPGP